MVSEFFRSLADWATCTTTIKDGIFQRRAIRLYKEYAGHARLQIFTPVSRANGSDSEKFIAASAILSRRELIELRNAIDEHIRDCTQDEGSAAPTA